MYNYYNYFNDQLPKINTELIDVYKEIISALLKQKKNLNYHIKKVLPETQSV